MDKLNIADLLKDCPSGMELNCTMYEDVYFDYVKEQIIYCYIQREHHKTGISFNNRGTVTGDPKSKCVIFPKGKTTWDGFQRPFKDGDIVRYIDSIAIFKEWGDETLFRTYVNAYLHGDSTIDIETPLFGKSIRREACFATEEEKHKLFNAIKTNGYNWNAETKTLEKLIKPKFKVGDYVRKKGGVCDPILILEVRDDSYFFNAGYLVGFFGIKEQDDWVLVPKKFDITTLKPFDKVLVRCNELEIWHISFFEKYNRELTKYSFVCINGNKYSQCVPYKDNEHLLDTADNCDDFYKTW